MRPLRVEWDVLERHILSVPCLLGCSSSVSRSLSCCLAGAVIILSAGCGSAANQGGTGSQQGQNTAVTVLLSGAANDHLGQFDLLLDSLTLTSQSGKSVSLLPTSENSEFIHLNGSAEPLVTVNVPWDVYTSASATVGAAQFECVTYNTTQNVVANFFVTGLIASSQITVSLPEAITLDESSMGLTLNLGVSQSANWTSNPCNADSGSFSVTPTFTLSSFPVTSQPASPMTGKLGGLDGMVISVDASNNSVTVSADDSFAPQVPGAGAFSSSGPVWQVSASGSTVVEGVPGLSAIAAGMPVNFDGVLQPNGSLLATRIAVPDPEVTNLSVYRGPLLEILSFESNLLMLPNEQQGYLRGAVGQFVGAWAFSIDDAAFQISGQASNLQNLPFAATFDGANMVAGQDVLLTTHATSIANNPVNYPATTITLVPQTIDGTVSAISTSGGFTVYTVSLAPYDLFPTLAFTNAEQTSPLTSPDTVTVYADADAAMLNTQNPSVGSLLRFTGLVFNDSGTLRMDCFQVSDGVPE